MLTYADICGRMLTYADVCGRMLTYADVSQMPHTELRRITTRYRRAWNLGPPYSFRLSLLRAIVRQGTPDRPMSRHLLPTYVSAYYSLCIHLAFSYYYICVLILYTTYVSSYAAATYGATAHHHAVQEGRMLTYADVC